MLRFRRAERGCVPLESPSRVSLDRPAPGREKSRSVSSSHDVQPKGSGAEETKVVRAKKDERQTKEERFPKRPELSASEEPMLETCENPPVFDLQDIPSVMEKIGWPVAATLARSWFSREKHVYNNDSASVQPIDDTTITLDWVLQFGRVKQRYDELLSSGIYNDNSLKILRKKIGRHLSELFKGNNAGGLSFNTSNQTSDLRQFSNDWQFQFCAVSTRDTANGNAMSDLTGALANFNIFAAVGQVSVYGDRYHRYDNKARTKTYCIDPIVEITHVFVYVKDNYSFIDADAKGKSQYLGHWNKTGVIATLGGILSDRLDGRYLTGMASVKPNFGVDLHTDLGNVSEDRSLLHTPYLTAQGLELLVDTRKGWIRKQRESDIYFPVFNRTYNEWREQHQQGGDFMIYSKPKYLKLKQPIKIKLDTLCRTPEPM
ncbi:DUF6402 family protein [Herbaspirillum rubrisubalbicans]|uniref:DUF6402 family protein n=1 Tax=Herbaspirillum rubrisubalbicans TaxID=80842 RepID=UPI0011BD4DE4|nr:DUF6402 family protein [Herbaspirillum rubrisubalbicans]